MDALRRVARARVGRMATIDASGHPHVVPFVFVMEGDTLYWAVDRKPKRSADIKRLANIRANPTVQLVVDEYREDWSELWWVRATGNARVLGEEDRAEASRALSLLAQKYPQYRRNPPAGPVVAIAVTRVTGWEAREG